MLDLNLLQTFLILAKAGSLGRAAQTLHLTPSAISQRLAAIETQLGCALFFRKKSGLALNTKGAELCELCSDFELLSLKIGSWSQHQAGSAKGMVRITTTPGLLNHILPDFLKNFTNQHIGISLQLDYQPVSSLVEKSILDGKSDIGLIVGSGLKSSLKIQKIIDDNSILMVCSNEHPLTQRKHTSPKELREHRFLWISNLDSQTQKTIQKKLGMASRPDNHDFYLPDMQALKEYALKGIGVAFLAKTFIQNELATGKLVAIHDFEIKRSAYLISRNDKYCLPVVTKFKDELITYCQKIT